MGWYVTCPHCGLESKYHYGCNCIKENIFKELKSIEGKKIENIDMFENIFGFTLFINVSDLDSKETETLKLDIPKGGGEGMLTFDSNILSEADYVELKEGYQKDEDNFDYSKP